MKHIDLFSGIGGFALAAEAVWTDIEHVFCDNDPFCQAVLKKHWPQATIYGDIRTFTNAESGRCGLRASENERAATVEINTSCNEAGLWEHGTIDLLTGGFPCQPFSQAGRRKGTADDRYLWPEMLRVIREFHPRWIIGENVGGFVTWNDGMVLEQVHTDLEAEGYEVQAFIIPACALNAPHRRDRVWIVANTNSGGRNSQPRFSSLGFRKAHNYNALPSNTDAPNRESDGRKQHNATHVADKTRSGRDSWEKPWTEVATKLCTLDDGLPNGLVRPRGWRNAALKGAGNAIVPQVAMQIMCAIKSASG